MDDTIALTAQAPRSLWLSSTGRLHAFTALALIDGGAPGEIQVMAAGTWKGHPDGAFTFDEAVFDSIIANFKRDKNPLALDYDHEIGRASGWVTALNKRQTEDGLGLFAQVTWTPRCAEMIRGGEYLFFSPEFSMKATDPRTDEEIGPTLHAGAMTNRPFLDGMQPAKLLSLTAARDAAIEETSSMADDTTEDVEMADEETTEDETEMAEGDAAVSVEAMLRAFVDQVIETSGGSEAAVLDALQAKSDEIGAMVRDLLDSEDGGASDSQEIPMSDDKTEDKTEAAKLAKKKREDAIAARAQSNTVNILASRVAKLESERKSEKSAANDAKIQSMVDDGRLHESERDDATWLLSENPKRFSSVYGKRAAGEGSPVGRGVTEESADVVDPNELTDTEKRVLHAQVRSGKDRDTCVKNLLAYRKVRESRTATH